MCPDWRVGCGGLLWPVPGRVDRPHLACSRAARPASPAAPDRCPHLAPRLIGQAPQKLSVWCRDDTYFASAQGTEPITRGRNNQGKWWAGRCPFLMIVVCPMEVSRGKRQLLVKVYIIWRLQNKDGEVERCAFVSEGTVTRWFLQ